MGQVDPSQDFPGLSCVLIQEGEGVRRIEVVVILEVDIQTVVTSQFVMGAGEFVAIHLPINHSPRPEAGFFSA